MRSESAIRFAVFCGLVGCAGPAVAEEEPPNLELLEYLGSWEESDEEWLLINEVLEGAAARDESQRNDGAPDDEPVGKESTELENES